MVVLLRCNISSFDTETNYFLPVMIVQIQRIIFHLKISVRPLRFSNLHEVFIDETKNFLFTFSFSYTSPQKMKMHKILSFSNRTKIIIYNNK